MKTINVNYCLIVFLLFPMISCNNSINKKERLNEIIKINALDFYKVAKPYEIKERPDNYYKKYNPEKKKLVFDLDKMYADAQCIDNNPDFFENISIRTVGQLTKNGIKNEVKLIDLTNDCYFSKAVSISDSILRTSGALIISYFPLRSDKMPDVIYLNSQKINEVLQLKKLKVSFFSNDYLYYSNYRNGTIVIPISKSYVNNGRLKVQVIYNFDCINLYLANSQNLEEIFYLNYIKTE